MTILQMRNEVSELLPFLTPHESAEINRLAEVADFDLALLTPEELTEYINCLGYNINPLPTLTVEELTALIERVGADEL